ncbi:MAG: Gfo/Idh/MocA family oxidoreductase [Kiritimatiellia bacterium]
MKNMPRRTFLKAGVTGAAGVALGFPAIVSARAPNSRVCHACIGTGNMAWGDLNSFKSHGRADIVALCDVDADYLARAHELLPNARVYADWRELLANEGDRIDSVNVSIPDHNHAIVSVNAMRRGKAVYCQKPLTHEMAECRLMREEAAKAGVVTQLGSQFAASLGDRLTVEILRGGSLGPVTHAWLFSTRSGMSRRKREAPIPAPVPGKLNWDLWIGTAPMRAYAEKVYHPLIWRIWKDFGSGWIGDIGCHLFSSLWQGLQMGRVAPISVRADIEELARTAPIYKQCWPLYAHVTWEFPGVPGTGGKPFRVEWLDGHSDPAAGTPAEFLPPKMFEEMAARTPLRKLPLEGKVIECAEAWIIAPHGGSSVPVIVMKNGSTPPKLPKLPRVPSHFHDFFNAILDGGGTRSDFAWSTYMMEAILCGNVAERVWGQTLQWDAEKMAFPNSAEASAFLTRAYRAGWKLPGLREA